jgi:hypothetical protein
MCDSMDLSPVSKLSSNFQDLYTAGNCDVPVRKSLFAAPAASAEASSSSSDAFASFSGLAELSSSASSVPCSTFKKPLGPSTKLARAKKLQHSDKRKPGSYIARSGATSTSTSSLAVPIYATTSSSSSSSAESTLPSLTASCDDVAASLRRAGRAQSFCFGDRSPLSPIDLDHDNRAAAMQIAAPPSMQSAKNLFNRSNRDTSPYQRSGSCPTSRRSTAMSSSSSNLPTLRLDQLPSMDCDDADPFDVDYDDDDADKENTAPATGASPYRPPLFQLSPSSSPSRSGRSGAMTDRSHARRPSAGLAPPSDVAVDGDADQFRIHRRGRGLSTSSASVHTGAMGSSSSPFGAGLSLTSSASSVATSPFGAGSSSSVSATSPFGAAADLNTGSSQSQSVSAMAPGARRLKMRVGRSLTMSCGSLPVLHPMSSATSGAMSLSTPDMREAHVPVLPTNPHASHSDLPCIDPTTLMRLLRGEFAGMFTRIFIIDCRFQYEYEGGHIRGESPLPSTQCMPPECDSVSRACAIVAPHHQGR